MADELDETVLQDYLEGNLDPETRQQVAAHLAHSAADRQRLAALESLLVALAELEEVPLENDLTPGIMAAVQAEAVPAVPEWLRLLPWLQFATALLLIALFWTTWQSRWLLLRTTFANVWPTLVVPDISYGQTVVARVTAVWQNTQIALPQFNLATYQWAWLLTLALIVWLLGNRLIFSPHNGGSHG